jgi:hypothetical protein
MFKKSNSCSVAGTGIKQYDHKPKTYLIKQQDIPIQLSEEQLSENKKERKRKSKYQRD